MSKRKERSSGIELLRILTACAVVILHYNDGRGFVFAEAGGLNHTVLFLLESLCICAVDLFVLISGFFLCTTQKRTLDKPVTLLLQTTLFKVGFYLLSAIFGSGSFSIADLLLNLIPNSYYVILYTALYLLSPYINVLLHKLTKPDWKKFMITLLLVLSVYPTFVDLSGELLNIEWMGLSSIGAWGSQQGFNLVNFILLYCVGAFLRLHGVDEKWCRPKVLIPVLLMNLLVIFAWAEMNRFTASFGLCSAWVYHNPLVILEAVVVFLLFEGLRFQNKYVNEFAKASFTCFILHSRFMDRIGIAQVVQGSLPVMLLHIILSAAGLYLLSWVVYKIYHLCTNWLIKLASGIHFPNVDF